MRKLFLVIALVRSNELLQAGVVQGLKGRTEHYLAIWSRAIARRKALSAVRNMAEMEFNLPAARVLEDFDVSFVLGDNIIMRVSTSADSYPLRLDKHSFDEIVSLYLQQVNQGITISA